MENVSCPLCNKKIYSGLGFGCKLCGMALNEKKAFCSKKCKDKFLEINERR